MPQELEDFRDVGVGDVLMIKQLILFKSEEKAKPWRWFGVVDHIERNRTALAYRLGADEDKPRYISIKGRRHGETVHLLHPDEWPDGVHALRAKLILLGVIDI